MIQLSTKQLIQFSHIVKYCWICKLFISMITQSMHAHHIHIAPLPQTPYPPHVLLFMLSILSSQREAQFPILVLLFFFSICTYHPIHHEPGRASQSPPERVPPSHCHPHNSHFVVSSRLESRFFSSLPSPLV